MSSSNNRNHRRRTGGHKRRSYTPEIQPRHIREARRNARESADGARMIEPVAPTLNQSVLEMFEIPVIERGKIKVITPGEARDKRLIRATRRLTRMLGVSADAMAELVVHLLSLVDAEFVEGGKPVDFGAEVFEATDEQIDADFAPVILERNKTYFVTCRTLPEPDAQVHVQERTVPLQVAYMTVLRAVWPDVMRRQPDVRMEQALIRAERDITRWREAALRKNKKA